MQDENPYAIADGSSDLLPLQGPEDPDNQLLGSQWCCILQASLRLAARPLNPVASHLAGRTFSFVSLTLRLIAWLRASCSGL